MSKGQTRSKGTNCATKAQRSPRRGVAFATKGMRAVMKKQMLRPYFAVWRKADMDRH